MFFDWNKASITAAGASVLDAVAQEAKNRNLNAVHIVGNADTSGGKGYNNKLGMRRANAIREALVQRGLDAGVMQVESHGEDDPLVPTPDGVREPANRRAAITFQ